ncbi:MAG: serine--tRNA ligase [Candidatus Coatesbacteria bacterium]|nr:MAG: serine--tRNA ligase [Candidatus Coatesbacteria bacterium]
MLDVKFIVENEAAVRRMLAERGAEADVDGILALAEKRRKLVFETDEKRAEQNRASEAIAESKKAGEDTTEAVAEMKALAAEVKELGAGVSELEAELHEKLLEVPNILHESVPPGETPEDNELVRSWGDPPKFGFPARAHYDLGEMLGILDVERAARVAGSRFAMTVGAGARLERALLSFFLDEASAAGYTEVFAPFLVNSAAMTGTGQLPKFGFDMYGVDGEDLWLNPTGEVPITNLHAGEILDGERLPLKYAGYTACFRREAGAHGRDTRGMMRVHQFNKVELVKITDAESSYDELESLTADAERLLCKIGLPHRVVTLCAGDLGFGAAKTYDVEVWIPSEETYREISSCTNYEEFQARRLQARWRNPRTGKPELVHTLNGSGLAIGRCVIAILENFQNADGSVKIPEALIPYMGGMKRIE